MPKNKKNKKAKQDGQSNVPATQEDIKEAIKEEILDAVQKKEEPVAEKTEVVVE